MNLVQQHCFFFILGGLMLFFWSKIINLLIKLLILLKVVLELVDCFLSDLVKLVFPFFYWSGFFHLNCDFFFSWSLEILLFNLHLFIIYFLSKQLSGNFLFLFFQKRKNTIVVFIDRWYWLIWRLLFFTASLIF